MGNQVKAKCLEMMEYMTLEEIFADYYSKIRPNAKYESFSRLFRKWKRQSNLLLEKGDFGFTPHATTVQLNGEGKVVQAWVKSKDDNQWFDGILSAIESYKHADIDDDISTEVKARPKRMLEIPLMDLHMGISNLEHYKNTLYRIYDIIEKGFDEIVMVIGSDLFHNNDLMGHTKNLTQIETVDMEQAWTDATILYTKIIKLAKRHSNKVRAYYVKGNHDETVSWAFSKYIEVLTGIEVDTRIDELKTHTWEEVFIGYTHKGDNDIDRTFIIDKPNEWARANVREIHVGHWHREKYGSQGYDSKGTMVRVLSTANKTDQWHRDNKFIGANKRFQVFEYEPDRLFAVYYV